MRKSDLVRRIFLALTLLLQVGDFAFHSHGAAGALDLSFDPGFGVNGAVNAIVVQPDGKVIIGGFFTTVRGLVRTNIARLNADGSGDGSFIPVPFTFEPASRTVYSLALQPDGKVLVGHENGSVGLSRLNADGSADTSFNSNAFAAVASSEPFYFPPVHTIAVQPDGKVFYAGETLVRLNANGTRDSNFVAELAGQALSLALQSDGKLIVSGSIYDPENGRSSARPVRLNANGSLDNSFNTEFEVRQARDCGPQFNCYETAYATTLALQPNGQALVGVRREYYQCDPFEGGCSVFLSYGVARLNANGTIDPSFLFTNGVHHSPLLGEVTSITLQSDGRIIVTSEWFNSVRLGRLNPDGTWDNSFIAGTNSIIRAVASQPDGKVLIGGATPIIDGTQRKYLTRLNANGTSDQSFAASWVAGPFSSLVMQPDGKVLMGGPYTFINGTNAYGSVRLNTDGRPDLTFVSATNFHPDLLPLRPYDDCPGAPYYCEFSAVATSAAVQPDGKVLVGGYVETTISGDETYLQSYRAILGRFHADGSPDNSFSTVIGTPNYDLPQVVHTLAVQADGRILVGGTFSGVNGTNRNSVARLNANGSLDTSFVPATGQYAIIVTVASQPDGKVLIAGSFGAVNGTYAKGIARLNANGSFDNTFNPITSPNGNVTPFVLQPDGKIVVGGSFTNVNGTNVSTFARLNANGSLDGSFQPGATAGGTLRVIALQSSGDVLLGGDFLTVNGTLRPNVARVLGSSPLPVLSITRSNNTMRISWPVTSVNVRLHETTNLSGTVSWSVVAQPAVTNGDGVTVLVPMAVEQKFFRLQSQ